MIRGSGRVSDGKLSESFAGDKYEVHLHLFNLWSSHLVKFLHRMFENSENEKLVNQLENIYEWWFGVKMFWTFSTRRWPLAVRQGWWWWWWWFKENNSTWRWRLVVRQVLWWPARLPPPSIWERGLELVEIPVQVGSSSFALGTFAPT